MSTESQEKKEGVRGELTSEAGTKTDISSVSLPFPSPLCASSSFNRLSSPRMFGMRTGRCISLPRASGMSRSMGNSCGVSAIYTVSTCSALLPSRCSSLHIGLKSRSWEEQTYLRYFVRPHKTPHFHHFHPGLEEPADEFQLDIGRYRCT